MAATTTFRATSLDRPAQPSAADRSLLGVRSPGRLARLAVLAPAVLMLVVGLIGLDRGSMWRDEAASLVASRRSLPDLATMLAQTDSVHALYYTFLHGWLALLPGSGVVWARVPSVLAMAAAVALVGLLGARLASVGVGVVAGLLLVVNPGVSFYAQEARSTALVSAVALLATWCLITALDRPGRARRWWVGYALSCVVLVGLNLLALMVPIALALTLVARRRSRRTLPAWALATAPAVLVVAVLLLVTSRQQLQIGWIPDPGLSSLKELTHLLLGAGVPAMALAGLLVLAGALPSTWRPVRRLLPAPSRAGLQALALPLLVLPPAALLLVSTVQPVFVPRYVFPSVLGAALLGAIGVERVVHLVVRSVGRRLHPGGGAARRTGALVAVALVVTLAVADLGAQRQERTPQSRPDDLAGAAAAVATGARPGDALLFLPDNRRLVAEVYPTAFAPLRDVSLAAGPEETGNLTGRPHPVGRVLADLGSASRVWVIGRPDLRLGDDETTSRTELALLDRDFVRAEAPQVQGVGIVLFVRRGTV